MSNTQEQEIAIPEGDSQVSTASVRKAVERSKEIEREIDLDPRRFRVLTGDRPTGKLHLGHYFGTLKGRVELQNRGVETWILIADYQVITDRDGVGPIRERVLGLMADYLAAGIDPEKSTIFAHSAVPALNQLMIPFLSLVTESELHRNPTVKAELQATGGRAMSGLLLTYPVHQAADILFCKANLVPVGQDQLPHIELTRQIASRFDRHGLWWRAEGGLLFRQTCRGATAGDRMGGVGGTWPGRVGGCGSSTDLGRRCGLLGRRGTALPTDFR